MTKARDIADFKFENIVDTGTEGTKIALGTTGQRGSTTGQLRFNSTTNLAEYYDGTDFKSIDSPPTVSSVSPTNFEQSTLPANLTITGSSFSSGANVTFTGSTGTVYNASSVTRNSSSELVAVVPNTITGTDEAYKVTVTNSSGLTASLDGAFNIDQAPIFSVASGSLGSIEHRIASDGGILTDIPATDDEGDTVTITTSSSLPTGLSLSTGGVWSGTVTADANDTTYNITATASDGTNSSTRNYSFINKAPSSSKVVIFGNTAGNEYIEHTTTGTFGNDLTICAWVKTLRDNNAGVIVQQGAEFYGNEYGWEWGLGTYTYGGFATNYNNRPVWMSDNNSGNHNASTLNISTNSISNNTWTWLAVTKSGSTITHYLNGSANGSGGIRTSSIAYGSGSALTISGKQGNTDLNTGSTYNGAGSGYGNGGTFQGYIDEVAIWNTALSANAISDLYNNMNNGYVDFNSSQGSNYTQTSNLQRWCAMGEFTNSSTEIDDIASGGWTMNNITSSNLVSR